MKKQLLVAASIIAGIGSAFAGFSKYVESTVSYSGSQVDDFPVLVKVNSTKIPGFYNEVQNAGADLKFTDEGGNGDYSYEVDVWDPAGESLIWVKIPHFANGTKFRMYYGDASKTVNDSVTNVWTGYVAVMHLGGVNGLNDSAAGYVGQLFGNDSTAGYDSTGPVGGGWLNSAEERTVKGGGIELLNSGAANLRSGCTISMWMKHKADQELPDSSREMLVYKRTNAFTGTQGQFAYTTRANTKPWEVLYYSSSSSSNWGTNMGCGQNLATDSWKYIVSAIDFSDGSWNQYCNGVRKGGPGTDASKMDIADNDANITIGSSDGESQYHAWKGSFDEIRIYDGVKDGTWVAAEYAVMTSDVVAFGEPKVPSTGIEGTFASDVVSGNTDLEIEFTANFHGGTGSFTYEWDFLGNGNFVSSGSSATASYTYTVGGCYSVALRVSDGVETTSVTNADMITVLGRLYVDSAAAAGGDGTAQSPYNSLADALAKAEYNGAIYVKGAFDIPSTTTVIDRDGFVLAGWGDVKPVFSLPVGDQTTAPGTGVFDVSASDVVISNLTFRFPGKLITGGPVIRPRGARVTITGCDFTEIEAQHAMTYNGVIGPETDGSVGVDMLVEKCTFTGIKYQNTASRVLHPWGGTIVRNCKFDDCGCILYMPGPNPWDKSQTLFVSNTVLNSAVTDVTGSAAGAIAACANWKFCQGLTIAYNLLVNTDANAGCIATVRGSSNPYQNGPLRVHNNTVIGYDALVAISDLTSGGKTVLEVFNNLCSGSIPALVDSQASWICKDNASFIKNNVRTGGDAYTVPNYPLEDHVAVADNRSESFSFVSTNPASPDFCRVSGNPNWITDAYVAGGTYPGYIGAIDPSSVMPPATKKGLLIFLR